MPHGRWGWRPRFREPHPVRLVGVAVGVGFSAIWYILFGLLWGNLIGYVRLTVLAAFLAGAISVTLTFRGDRGVAVGVAVTSAFVVAVTGVVLVDNWLHDDWLLW